MIVGANSPRIVGQRYEGSIVDNQYQRHNMPYLVVREATREEWEAQQRANLPSFDAELAISRAPQQALFYEISVD